MVLVIETLYLGTWTPKKVVKVYVNITEEHCPSLPELVARRRDCEDQARAMNGGQARRAPKSNLLQIGALRVHRKRDARIWQGMQHAVQSKMGDCVAKGLHSAKASPHSVVAIHIGGWSAGGQTFSGSTKAEWLPGTKA